MTDVYFTQPVWGEEGLSPWFLTFTILNYWDTVIAKEACIWPSRPYLIVVYKPDNNNSGLLIDDF